MYHENAAVAGIIKTTMQRDLSFCAKFDFATIVRQSLLKRKFLKLRLLPKYILFPSAIAKVKKDPPLSGGCWARANRWVRVSAHNFSSQMKNETRSCCFVWLSLSLSLCTVTLRFIFSATEERTSQAAIPKRD